MRIVSTDDMMPLEKPSVVCLGYFDGVHLGHMALLNAAREISKSGGMLMCVHTFDRSPAQEIHPEKAFPLLTPIPEKEALLEAAGSDVLAISRFDERMRRMPGRVFFEEVLLDTLNAEVLVTGEDHRFGFRGDTDVTALRGLCETSGIRLCVIPKVRLKDGSVISSTAIRTALNAGNIALAAEMLGRNPDPEMISRCVMRQER